LRIVDSKGFINESVSASLFTVVARRKSVTAPKLDAWVKK